MTAHSGFDPASLRSPKRIMVCGCAGAGKSYLSSQIGTALHVPVIHLDRFYWLPDWTPAEKTVFQAEVSKLAAGDTWVMDGNYKGTFEIRADRADLIIYLDLSTLTCMRRVFWRTLRGYGRVRKGELPEGCAERFNWEFFKYIARYRAEYRPLMLNKLASYSDRTVVVKAGKEIQQLLEKIVA